MSTFELQELRYPVATARQHDLIGLWRSAWTRTDYDWLESLNGDYADTLIANVVALPEHRGKGLGQAVAERCVAIGIEAGCDVALLGSSRHEGNVYERCGFRRVAGSIMRRDADPFAADVFVPGQAATIRPAQWGDLPGFARLIAEPLGTTVLDYPRGLLSPAAIAPLRCVSAFTSVWEDVQRHAGTMLVLASPERRIFGFATLTPGPGPSRRHRATIDFATHDAYAAALGDLLGRLLAEAETRRIETLDAHVATGDTAKRTALEAADFTPVVTIERDLLLRDGPCDVTLYRRTLRTSAAAKAP